MLILTQKTRTIELTCVLLFRQWQEMLWSWQPATVQQFLSPLLRWIIGIVWQDSSCKTATHLFWLKTLILEHLYSSSFFNVRLLSVLRGHPGFFHTRHNGQWPPTLKDFYPRLYPLHFCTILILKLEPVFPFFNVECQTREYWNHFYNVFDMTRSLTGDWTRDPPHSKPALYH